VTSRDVAAAAGVSRSAVSLVLNGRGAGYVSAEKQAEILRVAKRLHYTPNSVARSLRMQQTRTIGVVTDAIATNAFGGEVLAGASDAAFVRGYLLLVVDTQREAAREEAAFEALRARQVDGLMYAALSLEPFHAPPIMRSVPSALANCYEPDNVVPSFSCDEVSGGRRATELLLEQGHRDIAMLTGTPEMVATHRRVEGFLAATAAAGVTPRPPVAAGWTLDEGYAAAMALLEDRDPPTGLVCANDRVAMGVALAAARLGLSIPADLSIVGYDDDENVAPCMVPALTTIRLPHYEMGQHAIQRLLAEIGGDEAAGPEQVLLPCPEVVRDSVAPPPRRRRRPS
jgi:LacI family transcriptional regulator